MSRPRTFRAPGRVNLIGEHTDYNLGFVLPIAIDLATFIDTETASDGALSVWSEHRSERRSWPVAAIGSLTPEGHWSDYVVGVAQQLLARGIAIEPLSLKIRSTVPEGSGLSSSAALEISSALALLQGRELHPLEVAKLCQRAEIDFVGLPCGIMDHYVSVFGRDHAAIRIDCRSLDHEVVPIPAGVEIVAVNSMVKHELGASAYRIRVEECAAAAGGMRLRSLRDATLHQLEIADLAPTIKRRARHIITENARVLEFVDAAKACDPLRMGKLFVESHRSMQHDYEITCAEIDFLVDTAIGLKGCYGARMTGGGFGGCIVSLVAPDAVDGFSSHIRSEYQSRFGITPSVIRCVPAGGAGEIGD